MDDALVLSWRYADVLCRGAGNAAVQVRAEGLECAAGGRHRGEPGLHVFIANQPGCLLLITVCDPAVDAGFVVAILTGVSCCCWHFGPALCLGPYSSDTENSADSDPDNPSALTRSLMLKLCCFLPARSLWSTMKTVQQPWRRRMMRIGASSAHVAGRCVVLPCLPVPPAVQEQ